LLFIFRHYGLCYVTKVNAFNVVHGADGLRIRPASRSG